MPTEEEKARIRERMEAMAANKARAGGGYTLKVKEPSAASRVAELATRRTGGGVPEEEPVQRVEVVLVDVQIPFSTWVTIWINALVAGIPGILLAALAVYGVMTIFGLVLRAIL